jgi:hypothetical protein
MVEKFPASKPALKEVGMTASVRRHPGTCSALALCILAPAQPGGASSIDGKTVGQRLGRDVARDGVSDLM